MSTASTFSWIGPVGGNWAAPANWADMTTGQTPAVVTPGSLDVVMVSNADLTGRGAASSLTFLGSDTIAAAINAGAVDVAASVSMTTTIAGTGTIAAETFNSGFASIVDNGLIDAEILQLGTFIVEAGGHGPSSYSFNESAGVVFGTGPVEVQSGGSAWLYAPASEAGLTFQLDGTARLDIQAEIAAGNTINLDGDANTLEINGQLNLVQHPARTVGGDFYYTGGPPVVGTSINGFNKTDTLLFDDEFEINETLTSVSYSNGILTLLQGTAEVATYTLAGDFTNDTFTLGAQVNSQQAITVEPSGGVPCFVAGTRIATPRGAIPVDRLREGDTVLTASGEPQLITWIGWRRVDCRRHPSPAQIMPIRVSRDAFGKNLPKRPLLLSPDHAIFTDGVLIPIKYLVNGTTIAQVPTAEVTYYHVELPHHDILLAEGMLAEVVPGRWRSPEFRQRRRPRKDAAGFRAQRCL